MQFLRYGSIGSSVAFSQLGLKRAGYLNSEPDGIFGKETQNAVRGFQMSAGLKQDGIIGPRTWSALDPWLSGYREIRVRRGDSFFRIAEKYGISVQAMETANPEADPLNLQIGQRLIVPLPFGVVPDNIPFNSEVLRYCVRGLRARYPFIYAGSAGDSVLGTPLYLLKLGKGENRVFFNGAHHANEWITSPLLMRYLENYADAYVMEREVGGIAAAELYRRTTLSMIPMVNPDGVDLVTGLLDSSSPPYFSALTMNGALEGFPNNWKANIRGVDLNLQYPAGWETAKKIKFSQGYTKPGPKDYVGSGPLSEPESIAVYRNSRRESYSLTISYHAQGEVIYWKYLDFEPEGAEKIGLEFSHLSGYALALAPMESGYAGYKDWFIQDYNRPGYTVEVGIGTNPLPLEQLPGIYRRNESLLSYAQIATAAPELGSSKEAFRAAVG